MLWRGRYKNCDKGYSVSLPNGILAHATHSPNPNHGFVISAAVPSMTDALNGDEPRLIRVYDSYDAEELGSARAYVEQYVVDKEHHPRATIIENRDMTFRGLRAVQVRYRAERNGSMVEGEELVIYRDHAKNIGPIFYVISLESPVPNYSQDSSLYRQIRDGFHTLPVPKGKCSND